MSTTYGLFHTLLLSANSIEINTHINLFICDQFNPIIQTNISGMYVVRCTTYINRSHSNTNS